LHAVHSEITAPPYAFRIACRQLENRIRLFVNLRIEELDRLALKGWDYGRMKRA
jgi:hypothetical protein